MSCTALKAYSFGYQTGWGTPRRQDGFTHLTANPGFLVKVGNMFYKQQDPKAPWLVIVLDASKLSSEVGERTRGAHQSVQPRLTAQPSSPPGQVRFEGPAPVGNQPHNLHQQPPDDQQGPSKCPHLVSANTF